VVTAGASERFASWLSTDIGPPLRTQGFTKSGFNFHLRAPEGWGVVNFQKSQWGSRNLTKFTVNLGVALDKLAPIFDRDPTKKPPASLCHWSSRIGTLIHPDRDTWWSVDDRTDLQGLTAEILPTLMERALPAIDARLTAEGFLRALRRGDPLGQVPRPANVLALLKESAPAT
jgi:hypothetical protein